MSMLLESILLFLNFFQCQGGWETPGSSFLYISDHTAVWDDSTGSMYVYGGGALGVDLIHYTALTDSWTSMSLTGSEPGSRTGYTAVWDPVTAGMYVHAGYDLSGTCGTGCYNGLYYDLHFYSSQGNSWNRLSPGGVAPLGRYEHTAVWDSTYAVMYSFGGEHDTLILDDLHSYSSQNNVWTELSPQGTLPAARSSHTAVWDDAVAGMYVFGGYSSSGTALNDLHLYYSLLNSWLELLPSGSLPLARYSHTAVWASSLQGMLVFGGYRGDCG